MKSLLNIIGLLCLLGAVPIFSNSPTLGGASMLVSVTALGLAKLIALAETHLDRTSKQQHMEQEHWSNLLGALNAGAGRPVKPVALGAERYYIANGKEVAGPHDREKIAELIEKKIINRETQVCKEGTTQWRSLGDLGPGS